MFCRYSRLDLMCRGLWGSNVKLVDVLKFPVYQVGRYLNYCINFKVARYCTAICISILCCIYLASFLEYLNRAFDHFLVRIFSALFFTYNVELCWWFSWFRISIELLVLASYCVWLFLLQHSMRPLFPTCKEFYANLT